MSIEIIFYTQLASVLTFIVALFVLYRVLVSQKDATIELLKEKNDYLSQRLNDAATNTPDALAKSLNDRVKVLEDELDRLSNDKVNNQDKIKLKEKELDTVKEKAEELSRQIAIAHELMSEFSCPHCASPMTEKAYQSESVEYNGRDVDIDHEYYSYECGYAVSDGTVVSSCGGQKQYAIRKTHNK